MVEGDHNSDRPKFCNDSIAIFLHNTLLVEEDAFNHAEYIEPSHWGVIPLPDHDNAPPPPGVTSWPVPNTRAAVYDHSSSGGDGVDLLDAGMRDSLNGEEIDIFGQSEEEMIQRAIAESLRISSGEGDGNGEDEGKEKSKVKKDEEKEKNNVDGREEEKLEESEEMTLQPETVQSAVEEKQKEKKKKKKEGKEKKDKEKKRRSRKE